MQVNGLDIPEAGTTTQYIADGIGGWMYEVKTTTEVTQHNIAQFQAKLDSAKQQLAADQAIVDELEPQASAFEKAMADVALAPPFDVMPEPPTSATSTAAVAG